MTKEAILKQSYETVFSSQKYDNKCASKGVCDLFALPAMDIWAKAIAVDFAKWIPFNAVVAEDEYYYELLSNGVAVAEEELFELYLKSIQ